MYPLGFTQKGLYASQAFGMQLDDESGELDDKVAEHVPRKERRSG